ncbi:MAG: chromosome segregation protein SMC [Candidatus Gastranaerophilales bacterium]|nr:chromosome segregation protein SMC [Candidatus Gastranaerophilales bacterium]
MYIKSLEIDHFKSFANKVTIPFLQGFTTVAGPNGSGKSNIIDSILFALGLGSARTLRAEKLSDYISTHPPKKNEAYVKVTLALEGDGNEEISVARRIKKSSQGYISIYYLNDKVSTLSDIHYELEKYNITPNSYNVVMQNDVTGIAASSNTDRRKMIEEIAGTAEFDRQIENAEKELQVVESRVENTNIILEELAKTIERLSAEREVALKYEGLKNEKTTLESQVSAVKYFDYKKSLELVHESILESGKIKEKKKYDLKKTEDDIAETEKKYKEIQAKVKANGEEEQLEVIRQSEEVKGKIQRKNDAITQAETTIHNNLKRTIYGLENGIEKANEKIHASENNKQMWETEIEGFKTALKTAEEERTRILTEVTGLNQTAEAFIAQRTELQKELDKYRVLELDIEKQSFPLESSLSSNKTLTEKNRKKIEELNNFKATFADDKDRLELQVDELSKELEDIKKIQENSVVELANIKSEMEDKARDIDLTRKKLARLEAQKDVNANLSDRANDTVLNAKLDGVHNSLMNLGKVEEEYSTALEVAMGGRMRNIVVDDPDVAKSAIELLKSSRAGTTTFIPLNKIQKAPRSLNLPREKGVVDFAINLVDFDDLYLDAFFLALGETLIVEDYEVAKRLQGKYRMVTLSGELFDKGGAITGGGRTNKTGMKFASVSEDEYTKCTNKGKELVNQYRELDEKKKCIEERQEKLRQNYSNALNTYNTAKLELSSLLRQAQEADGQIETLQKEINAAENNIKNAEKQLDKLEEQRVEINNKMLSLDEQIKEIESKMSEGELLRLRQETQAVEDRIRNIESKINAKNSEIQNQQNIIDFQKQIIADNKEKIELTKQENIKLEEDKVRYTNDIKTLEEELKVLDKKKEELGEKLKQFQEERDAVHNELLEKEKEKDILVNDLNRINEQLESFRSRRKELEPLFEEITNELKNAGIKVETLVAPQLSTEEITAKIQRLQKRMDDLGLVNMNAIRSYDEQMARKAELDEKISVLSNERKEIEERMTQYGDAKKEAFLTTFNAINSQFKEIFEQLADGEGSLILEDEQNPFNAGMSMIAKPKGKESKKLIALSGGEKALTALALVIAIQRYMPAPFYALDEVDAPLDILNVPKLANIIKEQSKNTQFVVVSHREDMVKLGDRALGVTQKGKGVTVVTGVKLGANNG